MLFRSKGPTRDTYVLRRFNPQDLLTFLISCSCEQEATQFFREKEARAKEMKAAEEQAMRKVLKTLEETDKKGRREQADSANAARRRFTTLTLPKRTR